MKYKLIKNLSLSFFSLIIFLTIAEITTGIFWHPVYYKPHEGIILNGNSRTYTHKGIQYKTNSLGLRNEEVPFGRKETTFRLLVLGDSFIWGDGLDNEVLRTKNLNNSVI